MQIRKNPKRYSKRFFQCNGLIQFLIKRYQANKMNLWQEIFIEGKIAEKIMQIFWSTKEFTCEILRREMNLYFLS